MSLKEKKIITKIILQFRLFFKPYPAISYLVKWLSLSTIIGCLIGSATAGFLHSLDWVTTYREEQPWLIALLPIGGLGIGLIYHYWGKDLEGGNNLLIETIYKPKQVIPFKLAPFVYLGTLLTHLLGGSAGREGTALQMAGAIADQLSNPFKLTTEDRKILIIAAIAAGFGAVFGTPLAGAIFGLEICLIGRIRYKAILPAFAAALIADVVTKLWHAHHTGYHIDVIPAISLLNLFYAMVAGLAFGLCAMVFSQSMHTLSSVFKSVIKYPPLRPLIGGVLVVIIVWSLGTTKFIGLGIPTIVAAFDQPLPSYDFVLKMALTILTLAAGFKGGEVTPLFFIGATLGNALSYFIPLPTGLLAGMGFVAVFAGATNTPLACAVMAIELFGSECSIYAMIACGVAYLVSGRSSIYKSQFAGAVKQSRFTNYWNNQLRDL